MYASRVRRPVITRLSALVTLAAALGVGPAAQEYRLGVPGAEPVLFDFLAIDRAGQPVLDLKADEIQLKIDGRARPVVSLQLVNFTEVAGATLTETGESTPPPFGSNAVTAGRSVVILIDDDSIRPGRERDTMAAVGGLLESLPAHARVVIATPQAGWKTKLTADRAELRRALADIAGHASAADDVECRTRVTLNAVRAAISPFRAEAAPTVLVISGGLAGPRQDIPAGSNGLARASGRVQVNPCDLRIEDFLKVSDAIANTRAHLYVIQPDDVLPSTNMEQLAATPVDLNAGLNNLAGVAGGKLLHLTPSSGNPLIAAERESSRYYLVGFEPTAAESTGSTHRIDVSVSRPRITVVRRPDVTIEKTAPALSAPAATTPGAMLRDPRTRRSLPLRAAGYASRNADPSAPVRVVMFAETLGPGTTVESAAAGLFDPRGRLVSEWTSTPGSLGSGPLIAALSATPGTYRLRIAAIDKAGRAGTADYFVDALLEPAGPLKLSALMLGTLRNGGMSPALEFTSEPTAIASLDIYGSTEGKPIAAILEVAESVNGPALLTFPVQIAATREPDVVSATASIPIVSLTAGDYVVRVTVNLLNAPQGRVVRTLRKR
jgi:VWFA-related protein